MSNIPKFILTILALVFLSLSSIGQISQTSAIIKIDSIVNDYMTTNKMVGVSIGIVKDGKIYLTKGYGTAEIDKEKPIDSLTNFLTCSVTKLFTATAIMQLSEQGKIDISKKLVFYLPDFKMKDDRYKDITIEQLLTHTSGLYWDMKLKHSPNDSSSLRKLVYSLKNKILDFAPGAKFNPTETYSNAAYDILGYLVQTISGKQYEDYIRDNILVKANMPNSSIDYKLIPTGRRSAPHMLKGKVVKVGGIYSENVEHSPSGNLNSCSIDLCNWMMHNLNIYNNPNSFNGILQNNTLKNMWTTRHVTPQNKKVSIGLGWWITSSDDLGNYYWHVGDNPGFSATLMVLPEHNFGITVLCNGMYAEQIVWNKIPFDIINLFKDDWKN
jgi:CubicO group peptidase (beta-lactamase class C family)